jgi:hypothetical protein
MVGPVQDVCPEAERRHAAAHIAQLPASAANRGSGAVGESSVGLCQTGSGWMAPCSMSAQRLKADTLRLTPRSCLQVLHTEEVARLMRAVLACARLAVGG